MSTPGLARLNPRLVPTHTALQTVETRVCSDPATNTTSIVRAYIDNTIASYRIVSDNARPIRLNVKRIADVTRLQYGFFYQNSLKALKGRICLDTPATRPLIMVWTSGNVNQLGDQTPEHALVTAQTVAYIFSRITGRQLRVVNFRVTNIVSQTLLPPPDMRLWRKVLGASRYEHEKRNTDHSKSKRAFPALIGDLALTWKFKNDKKKYNTFELYKSGKAQLPGNSSRETIRRSVRELWDLHWATQRAAEIERLAALPKPYRKSLMQAMAPTLSAPPPLLASIAEQADQVLLTAPSSAAPTSPPSTAAADNTQITATTPANLQPANLQLAIRGEGSPSDNNHLRDLVVAFARYTARQNFDGSLLQDSPSHHKHHKKTKNTSVQRRLQRAARAMRIAKTFAPKVEMIPLNSRQHKRRR